MCRSEALAPASSTLVSALLAALLAGAAGQGIALPANSAFPPGVTSNPFGEPPGSVIISTPPVNGYTAAGRTPVENVDYMYTSKHRGVRPPV